MLEVSYSSFSITLLNDLVKQIPTDGSPLLEKAGDHNEEFVFSVLINSNL